MDVFVRAVDVFEALKVSAPDSIGDPPPFLLKMEHVVDEFLAFFVEGAAAE